MHPTFGDAGRKAGLQIWRIENFEPVAVLESDYGKFHEGDSYIVLSTVGDGSRNNFKWDIHFWLGNKTSQDESGAAARLSVDLDDALGGGPVQHREVQGHESSQFLELFDSGVRYMPGGKASGFHHVDINAGPGEKRLYHIKGKKNVRVQLVEPKIKSMNKGDCFILDSGKTLYLYVGPESKVAESMTARRAVNRIRDQDHSGRADIIMIDSSASEDEVNQFFAELGSGSANEVPDASTAGDDLEFEKKIDSTVSLYKVSDEGGKLRTEKVGEKPLIQSLLKADDCFILDAGASGIYVWVGKGSNPQEKVESFNRGQAFLEDNKYPGWTTIKRIVQGAEPASFREYFAEWKD